MKVQLTKPQIMQLYKIMGKNRKENTELYNEIKDILRLYTRVKPDKFLEITINETEVEMVREMLPVKENDR